MLSVQIADQDLQSLQKAPYSAKALAACAPANLPYHAATCLVCFARHCSCVCLVRTDQVKRGPARRQHSWYLRDHATICDKGIVCGKTGTWRSSECTVAATQHHSCAASRARISNRTAHNVGNAQAHSVGTYVMRPVALWRSKCVLKDADAPKCSLRKQLVPCQAAVGAPTRTLDQAKYI